MKFFLALALICAYVFGAVDKDVEQFLLSNYKKNPGVAVKSIKILSKDKMANGYEAVRYIADLSVMGAPNGAPQSVKVADIVFIKDGIIAPELFEASTGKSLKDDAKPKLPLSVYKDANFVIGNKNAKYKIVIFSDPLCPFCRDVVPDIITMAEKNPTKVGVWHYAFPLINIHPASETMVKAEFAIGSKMPAKEVLLKLYKLDLNPKETDESKILAAINKDLGTKLTPKDIDSKAITDRYNSEIDFGYQMIIRGTPSLYVNGDFDAGLTKTGALMKELGK